MKKASKLFGLLMMAMAITFVSCDKDDDKDTTTPPEITEFKAGSHDHSTNQIPRGGEIIVDFKVRSLNDGRLEAYHIEIHDHPESGNSEDEYLLIDEFFDNDPTFKGTRNATVHKHIAVPMEAPLGEYHVEVFVIDEFGNTSEVETHIYIVAEE
ncbi:MAG: DUF4625 domain-containing protein [Bacteroidetes bacterium]|nr:MAG: DUF4625 domain-containing protein [Bacteroidota bacterium]